MSHIYYTTLSASSGLPRGMIEVAGAKRQKGLKHSVEFRLLKSIVN